MLQNLTKTLDIWLPPESASQELVPVTNPTSMTSPITGTPISVDTFNLMTLVVIIGMVLLALTGIVLIMRSRSKKKALAVAEINTKVKNDGFDKIS